MALVPGVSDQRCLATVQNTMQECFAVNTVYIKKREKASVSIVPSKGHLQGGEMVPWLSIDCSSTGPEFDSQYPQSGS